MTAAKRKPRLSPVSQLQSMVVVLDGRTKIPTAELLSTIDPRIGRWRMTFAIRNVGGARVGIAVLVLFLVGRAMAALVSIAILSENKDSFGMLIGGLNNATGMVIGYFFDMTRRGNGA